ncbi:hypothetical protein C1M51_02960 [Methylibium sp. Pch-M]|uniref:hypothetical protein n=1 Tax=Methylibium sp. Pch-M TaxID=2082386 RepID=UPI001011F39A|nr:hypothetical protein [Methylibium sp. Pch-M]QAZ38465.1 hypothetical protein C1M51_02960 [Methylibium sp. Pch-M]
MSAQSKPLDINAAIVGNVVELRYTSHGEAVRQLYLLREHMAQRDELLEALRDLSDIYARIWDRVDGALVLMPDSIDRFEKAQEKACAAITKTGGPA